MKWSAISFAAAICSIYAAGNAVAADVFKRLNAPAMRAQIVGKVVTDQSHWSDRFAKGGVFDAMELGQRKAGSWRIDGNDMCVTRKARKPAEECFEIWMAEDRIEYRRGGVVLRAALLRNE